MADEVKVEQIDREAAADAIEHFYVSLGHPVGRLQTPYETRAGLRDHTYYPQLFARHRLAARPAPAEDAVEREDEIERLRSALAPFAKAGSIAGERNPYGDFYAYRPAAGDEYAIMGDHLRAALAAMQPRGEQQAGREEGR